MSRHKITSEPILWWGYKHVHGTLNPKRFFDKKDLKEAAESDFVVMVMGPFAATGRIDAMKQLKAIENSKDGSN